MSEETTGDPSGVLKGRNGAPPPGGARGHAIHDWRRKGLPPARGLNPCGQRVNTPGDRRGPPPAFNPPCNDVSAGNERAPGTGRQFRRGQASAFAPAGDALPAGASNQRPITRPTARRNGRC